MLLSFKLNEEDPGPEVWVNPKFVACVFPTVRRDVKSQMATVVLSCGKDIQVLDKDHMVAKIIRDAQHEGGW